MGVSSQHYVGTTFSVTPPLQKMGFVLNPYDQCVANCDSSGKQCTIVWYVNDIKISHVDPVVVSMIIEKIKDFFGKMNVTRGPDRVFLGMNIHYDKDAGTTTIKMRDYLTEAIADSQLDISRSAATPANNDLFELSKSAVPLSKAGEEVFHGVVTKLLYVSIRARMSLLLATSLLTTRVLKPRPRTLPN
jgi:hypothetical protein